MPQVSLLSGITTDQNAEFRVSYPINMIPVPQDTGISKGRLRFAPGLTQFATAIFADRGGIAWDDTCYRVSGGKLVKVGSDAVVTTIGDIAGTELVALDYGPTYLCIVGGQKAYLYDRTTLTQFTDSDMGAPIDVVWVDGYFLFTDGAYLYVNDLATPFSIDPLKYASSEIDPDRITGVLKYRNEIYALNRYTIEVFDNVGGTGFPFRRIPGGLITKGCVGPRAKTLFAETFAWVGSGRNEPCSIYIAAGGQAAKIATREVELRLKAYTETELATALVEAKSDEMHQHLYVHLPNETMVYDAAASAALGQPVWFFLSTGMDGIASYRAWGLTWCYGRWLVGDKIDGRIGYVDDALVTQYGQVAGWQFDCMLLYHEGKGAEVHSVELTGTTGRAPGTEAPVAFLSYTIDGENWSDEKRASMGRRGETQKRVVWRRQGKMRNYRGLRFRGANATPISWVRLDAELEGLNA